MRNTVVIAIVLAVVFVLLRSSGLITPGWFLGLGALCAAAGIFILVIMAGAMEGDWQLQLGGLLLTLGIVLLIVSWILSGL